MTIRSRLVGWALGLFAAVLLTAGAASVFLLQEQLIDDIDTQLTERSNLISRAAEREFDFPRPDLPPSGSSSETGPFRTANDMAIVVTDDTGMILFSVASGPSQEPDALPDISQMDLSQVGAIVQIGAVGGAGPEFRAVASALGSSDVISVLAIPIDGVRSTIASMTLIIAGVGALAILVLGISVWLAIRRGLQPIDDMIDAAGYIGEGDLSHRIPAAEPNTEVGQLAVALNAMLGQIETAVDEKTESEERMRRFLSDASHELRTPLTSIRGYAELYRHGATSPDDVERSLDRIEGEAARMGGLVEDLLLLARLDQDRPLAVEPVDLDRLVRDTATDARAVEPERSIIVKSEGTGTIIVGDEDRLRQAIGNLLANVRQHTPGDAEVTIAISSESREAVVTVSDDGPGMPADEAQMAFERFYQADTARGASGAGLGLSIVEAIVAAHGGHTEIVTDVGEGFAVAMRFPLGQRAASTRGASTG